MKIPVLSALAVLTGLFFATCYEPKKACLDLAATNFDVSADDPCKDCCTYPQLTVQPLHLVILPTQPDTIFPFRYDSIYPSPFDTNQLFSIRRIRFFLSDIILIGQGGEQLTVQDSIELEAPKGVSRMVKNNFAKLDRDIFQANVLGTVTASGVFDQVKFRFGLQDFLLQTDPASVPTGHPLAAGDTILYDSTAGFASAVLIFKTDTLSDSPQLNLRLTESQEITLPLEMPVDVAQGFNLKLTLRLNCLALFDGINLQNESEAVIRVKIVQNLPKLFFGAALEMD